jgi:hypothetical protein
MMTIAPRLASLQRGTTVLTHTQCQVVHFACRRWVPY